jgi:hypothetical protein
VSVVFRDSDGNIMTTPDSCDSSCDALPGTYTDSDTGATRYGSETMWAYADGGGDPVSQIGEPTTDVGVAGVAAPSGAASASLAIELYGPALSHVYISDAQLFKGGLYATAGSDCCKQETNLLPMAQSLTSSDLNSGEDTLSQWQSSFEQTPAGGYWVTATRPGTDTPVVKHITAGDQHPYLQLDPSHKWNVSVDGFPDSTLTVADPRYDTYAGEIPTLPYGLSGTGLTLTPGSSSDPEFDDNPSFALTATSDTCGADPDGLAERCFGNDGIPGTPAIPNQITTASVEVDATAADRKMGLVLVWFDKDWKWLGTTGADGFRPGYDFSGATEVSLPEGGWQQVSVSGCAPPGAAHLVAGFGLFGNEVGETTYLNDYKVTVTPTDPVPATCSTSTPSLPDILLTSPVQDNAGMDPTGWTGGSGTTWTASTDQSQASPASLKVQASGDIEMQGQYAAPVNVGDEYQASTWVRADDQSANATVTITWYDSSGAPIGSEVTSSPVADSTDDWTQLTVTGTAPTGAVTAKISVGFADTAGHAHYLDSTSLNWT